MKVVKFVTLRLESPGRNGKIFYGNWNVPIEVENPDPPEIGQCGRGIHVIPLEEPIDFSNVISSQVLILLEVDESDIIFREGNGKMRVRKATPLKILQKEDPEWQQIVSHGYACVMGIVERYEKDGNSLYYKYRIGKDEYYYKDGSPHRMNGPAIIYSNSIIENEYWIDGKFIGFSRLGFEWHKLIRKFRKRK